MTTDPEEVPATPKRKAAPARKAAAKSAPSKAPAKASAGRKRTAKTGKTTKEAILLAAEIEFARSGYDGASVQRIGKQAKCYESLLYYHYGSKDKLFAAVLENAYRKLVEAEGSWWWTSTIRARRWRPWCASCGATTRSTRS